MREGGVGEGRERGAWEGGVREGGVGEGRERGGVRGGRERGRGRGASGGAGGWPSIQGGSALISHGSRL